MAKFAARMFLAYAIYSFTLGPEPFMSTAAFMDDILSTGTA